MQIKFWGTRGSIPSPGRDTILYGGNTTCLELRLERGRRIIIDAGSGIRAAGEELIKNGIKEIYLFITHIHWDHIMGFPFFNLIYDPTCKIIVDGYPSCMKGLRYTFDTKMGDGFFPITFDQLKAKIVFEDRLRDGPLEIDDTIIDRIPLKHPQGGYGFKFIEGDKKIVFLTDNELRENALKKDEMERYKKFCEGVDILIHDSQYTPEELEEKKGWGHSDFVSVTRFALDAGVKRLILFHHDPSRKDHEIEGIEEKCRAIIKGHASDMKLEAAKEGYEIIL